MKVIAQAGRSYAFGTDVFDPDKGKVMLVLHPGITTKMLSWQSVLARGPWGPVTNEPSDHVLSIARAAWEQQPVEQTEVRMEEKVDHVATYAGVLKYKRPIGSPIIGKPLSAAQIHDLLMDAAAMGKPGAMDAYKKFQHQQQIEAAKKKQDLKKKAKKLVAALDKATGKTPAKKKTTVKKSTSKKTPAKKKSPAKKNPYAGPVNPASVPKPSERHWSDDPLVNDVLQRYAAYKEKGGAASAWINATKKMKPEQLEEFENISARVDEDVKNWKAAIKAWKGKAKTPTKKAPAKKKITASTPKKKYVMPKKKKVSNPYAAKKKKTYMKGPMSGHVDYRPTAKFMTTQKHIDFYKGYWGNPDRYTIRDRDRGMRGSYELIQNKDGVYEMHGVGVSGSTGVFATGSTPQEAIKALDAHIAEKLEAADKFNETLSQSLAPEMPKKRRKPSYKKPKPGQIKPTTGDIDRDAERKRGESVLRKIGGLAANASLSSHTVRSKVKEQNAERISNRMMELFQGDESDLRKVLLDGHAFYIIHGLTNDYFNDNITDGRFKSDWKVSKTELARLLESKDAADKKKLTELVMAKQRKVKRSTNKKEEPPFKAMMMELSEGYTDNWAGTSGDHDAAALALQYRAKDYFGIDDKSVSHLPKRGSKNIGYGGADQIGQVEEREGKFIDAYIEAVYEETQDQLEKQGIDELVLYRGMDLNAKDQDKLVSDAYTPAQTKNQRAFERFTDELAQDTWTATYGYPGHGTPAQRKKWIADTAGPRTVEKLKELGIPKSQIPKILDRLFGKERNEFNNDGFMLYKPKAANISWQPLSSWTSDPGIARGFGQVVFQVRVPRSQVWSTAVTGPGCLNEQEYVILGGTTKATVVEGLVER